MRKVMMSISPVYFKKILLGEKLYEYRKKRCVEQIDTIVMYVGRPLSKVLGEMKVDLPIEGNPEEVWEMTREHAGITKSELLAYSGSDKIIYAYPVKDVIVYDEPRELQDYGIKYPPQLFYYL